MGKRFLDNNLVQLALMQALNNTNVTGKYFDMRNYRNLTGILTVLGMAATKTAKLEFLQATDADGTDAKGIPTTAGQEATKTVTANTEVIEATLTFSTIIDTDAFVINGLTFTCEDTDPAVASRQFASGASDTAAAENAIAVINHATYGVPGVTATASSGVITLVADDGYDITVSTEDATITIATVEAIAAVDVNLDDLDTDDEFYYVAPKVTVTANATAVSVVVIESDGYRDVTQVVPYAQT